MGKKCKKLIKFDKISKFEKNGEIADVYIWKVERIV